MTNEKIQKLIDKKKEALLTLEENIEKNTIILDTAFFNDAIIDDEYEDLCYTVEQEYEQVETLKEEIERLEELLEMEDYCTFYKEFYSEIF